MKKKLTSSKTANDPDSRINKSRRAGTADMKNFKQFLQKASLSMVILMEH